MKLIQGDCLDKLKQLDDNSVDSIVTDPPYGLSFMGKKWDYDVPSQAIWEECIRVLKPGGHLLAFAGSRTYHRMAVRIEDAGFEIRDQIMWIYGSGFPKSHNIGKAINKTEGVEFEKKPALGVGFMKPNSEDWNVTKNQLIQKGESSDLAKKWEGWGTALKPAHEPIVMARKPFKGNVAQNVLEWGTGGINIDDSRIEGIKPQVTRSSSMFQSKHDGRLSEESHIGRFPANIIFDEEAGKMLDEQSGISKSTGGRSGNKEGIWDGRYNGEVRDENPGFGDVGGASRFFYCPKTSKKDRNKGNIHPTVKPTDLMLYLIRLVTQKGGIVLDPFMGSGSTGKAAVRGGFYFIGIEREDEYIEISKNRIKHETDSSRLHQTALHY